ncbi:flavin-containing monooxygenase [Nocardia sp. NPDC058379]|uniref:flavin-containing monooxygenase n=1 Tax=unclassified Nocardia TaxID=2637762 RepID=UPI00365CF93D
MADTKRAGAVYPCLDASATRYAEHPEQGWPEVSKSWPQVSRPCSARPLPFTVVRDMTATETVSAVIIGAGFAGLAMAREFIRTGIEDFLVLEQARSVGGVWRENSYPGAACDVPSAYYSFADRPNPAWTRRYAGQAQIVEYLRAAADEPEVRDRIRCGVEVTALRFDEQSGLWTVETADGTVLTARTVIPATGQLSRPALPELPGIAGFAGPSFHSAQWRHDVDLRGKRVAVIGTGASAIQFVPRIQPQVADLVVFQRSAPYVLPKPDGGYGEFRRGLFRRAPITLRAERGLWWGLGELWTFGMLGNRAVSAAVRAAALGHLRARVRSGRLRESLTPDYEIGCKRVLFSNDYYPAVSQPNVRVVTDRVAEVTATGVRTADGIEHPADVIIYGTGFATQRFLGPIEVSGREALDLHQVWSEGARAYLGMTVPNFPNLFLMYGPNTNLGTGSIIFMLERQAEYIRQAVRHLLDRPGMSLDVRPDIEDHYDQEIQQRLTTTAWAACASWYRSATSARITSNWPGLVSEYARRTRRFGADDFVAIPTRNDRRIGSGR